MKFRARRIYTKTDAQDWSGIALNKSKVKKPKPHENESKLDDAEKQTVTDYDQFVKEQEGYAGWDYSISGNNLTLDVYFNTEAQAARFAVHLVAPGSRAFTEADPPPVRYSMIVQLEHEDGTFSTLT